MNIMNNPNDPNKTQNDWLKSAINELDESVENMDSIDASRLRTARQMAYRKAEEQRQTSWSAGLNDWLRWKNGMALACTVAVVATVTFNLKQPSKPEVITAKTTQQQKPKVGIEVIPLLTANEDLEFYESVNFLLWLEQQQGKS